MTLPLSGSEPVYESPSKWDTNAGVGNNNCYNYAMNDFRKARNQKTVPGDKSGYKHDIDYASCRPVEKRFLDDHRDRIYRERPEAPCKEGFYKVMMVVSSLKDGGYGDFHFYRQNKDVIYKVEPGDTISSVAEKFQVAIPRIVRANKGSPVLKPGTKLFIENANVFSHKLGWGTGGLVTDSCGKVIKDPRKACRNHALPYDQYCGSYCVKAKSKNNNRP